jgi:LmbE family N-acetylglucosaminyl deacetylase
MSDSLTQHSQTPQARQDRVLVFAVHPDDETLGAGGLIQKALKSGSDVRVIIVTDGDNNPWPQRYIERRWKILPMDRERWGKRRHEEAVAALSLLGVTSDQIVFWGLPDQGLTALLTQHHAETVARISNEIALWQPSCIVAPALQDKHPDHNAFGLMVELALQQLGQENPAPQVLYYLIHGQALYASALNVELDDAEQQLKRKATLCHSTQMALGRQRFLKYAKPRESYHLSPSLDSYQLQHPVRVVSVAPPLLTLHIQTSAWIRRFGKPSLTIMSGTAAYRVDLDVRGQVNITECVSNAIMAQAFLVEGDDTLELSMPLSLFKQTDRLFFKLERRGVFFDTAGWRGARLETDKAVASVIGLMPCYEVEDFCEQVILKTVRQVDHLIVVDDGSSDGTTQITRRLAVQLPGQICLIRFERNHGKGVALMAGFIHALNHFDFDTLITIDADGQHPPGRIPALVEKIREGAEMVIGERQVAEMPGRSRIGNTLATNAIRWLHPHAPSDTQSGMRAFSRALIEEIACRITGSRYETEFQILLLALGKGKRIATVEIPTIYIDNNRSSKFRPVLDTLRIARAMIHWR